ncbi:MAG: hypothetical protein R6X20_08210 [Phycisphaerae bacterium]
MTRQPAAPAEKPITVVLAEFLDAQRRRLKPRTVRRYEDIIDLFENSMNGYAYQSLSDAESALFEDLYDRTGPDHREFCEIFGPEKIPENVGEFLHYFMPHKVICGTDLLRAAGTTMRKLGKWLSENGYIGTEAAADMAERGGQAAKDLPAAETLAETLDAYAERFTGAVSEEEDGHFTIETVRPDSLVLSSFLEGEEFAVPVPKKVARMCKEGWTLSGCLGRTAQGWRLLEVWGVYT